MTNWQKWLGVAACIILIAACFMHWAYYPDIQKHFTGFDTGVFYKDKGKVVNYYGRPGIFLCFFAAVCIVCHLIPKLSAKRINLLFAALCLAYAIRSFIMFSAGYAGYVPQREIGLWLMGLAAITNMGVAIAGKI